MQKHRIISLASILAMLLIPVVGWFLVAQPQVAAAASADQQRIDTAAQIEASSAIVDGLRADSANMDELSSELDKLRTSIPAGVDSSAYLDGLSALASASSVTIRALTVGDAAPYVAAVPPVDPNAVAPDASAEGAEADGAAAAPVPVVDPAIVTNELITSSTFITIPVTVDVEGGWSQILDFVKGLQSGDRLFLVSKISTSEDATTGSLVASIGGFIYALPGGLAGDPSPVSTQVKIMDTPVVAPVESDDDATGGSTPKPTPSPTGTPKP